MSKWLFDFLMILNEIQTNSILSFHQQKRRARANFSEYAFIVSRRVDLKLSFRWGRKATKMDANLPLLSRRAHTCERTACVCTGDALCKGNVTHPTLPGSATGLRTHRYSTYVQLQTPEGKGERKKKKKNNHSSLRSAPPSHFCSLRQAIYSFRIN